MGKKKGKKGKLGAGLRKWMREQKAKKSASSQSKAGSTVAKKKKGRKSGGSGKSRGGSRRRSGGGGGGGLSFVKGGGGIVSRARGFVSKDMILAVAGGAAGMLAANQLAPRIATWTGGKAGTATRLGQAAIKVGIGALGGAALMAANKPLAAGFAVGAIAEPIAGSVRSMIAQQEAKAGGVSSLQGLGALHQINADSLAVA